MRFRRDHGQGTADQPRMQPRDEPSRVIRVVLPSLVFLGTLGFLVRWSTRQQVNADTYFHLRMGDEFLTHWTPWAPGSLTPYASRNWLPSQWLSQIAMASTEKFLGLEGVVWLSGAVMIAYAVVVLRACRRESSLLVATTLTMIVMAASTPSLSARPQVISFVLTAVTVSAWLRTSRDSHVRWWLIPLTWLWVMLHGMWLVGISISVVAALGHVLDGGSDWRRRLKVLGVPVGSALLAAVTPMGPGIYGAVLLVGSRSDYFNEWDPPTLTDPPTSMMLALVLGALLVRMRRDRDLWTPDLMLLTGLAWGIYSGRTVPVAAVIGAVLLARQLRTASPFRVASRRESRIVVAIGLLAALGLASVSASAQAEPSRPQWLDDRLEAMPRDTPIFSDLQFGGYLLWRYPDITTIAHGYADMYTTEELDLISDVSSVDAGWDDALRDLGAQYVLLGPDEPLTYALTHSAGWRVLETSDRVLLLAPPVDW